MSTLQAVILTAALTPLVLSVLMFGWKGLLFPLALFMYLINKIMGR